MDDICVLCQYVTTRNLFSKLGPPFAFSLWVAARVLLVAGSTEDNINPAIHPLITALQRMGAHWNVAQRYTNILQRVMDEYLVPNRAVNGTALLPPSLRTIADMRRCAYDLEFLISAQSQQDNGAEQEATAQLSGSSALDYLDMFDFFNLPNLAQTLLQGQSTDELGTTIDDSAMSVQWDPANSNAHQPGDMWTDWLVQ